MKLSNNWGDKIPPGYLLPPDKNSSTRTRFHLIELFAKEIPWELPNNSGYCHNHMLLSTNRHQGPTVEDNTCITFWTQTGWAGTYRVPLCSSDFGTGRYSVCYQKSSINTKPATDLVIYNGVLLLRYHRVMMAKWKEEERIKQNEKEK